MSGDVPTGSDVHTVQDETPCSRCGYSLKGLPLESKCPECARSVAESLRDHSSVQDLRPTAPLSLCAVRFTSLAVVGVLLAIAFVVVFTHGLRRLGGLPFVGEAGLTLLFALVISLGACIAGTRYRDGDRWMNIWAFALGGSLLAAALFSIV